MEMNPFPEFNENRSKLQVCKNILLLNTHLHEQTDIQ